MLASVWCLKYDDAEVVVFIIIIHVFLQFYVKAMFTLVDAWTDKIEEDE
jgi:hypothetical protein